SLEHGEPDGVSERKTRGRGGQRLSAARADALAIQVRELRQLESEQRQRQEREGHERRIHLLRGEDHRRAPGECREIEQQAAAVRDPRQPAGEEVIALAEGERASEGEEVRRMRLQDLYGAVGPAIALLLVVDER